MHPTIEVALRANPNLTGFIIQMAILPVTIPATPDESPKTEVVTFCTVAWRDEADTITVVRHDELQWLDILYGNETEDDEEEPETDDALETETS